jgi:hypothetical protein
MFTIGHRFPDAIDEASAAIEQGWPLKKGLPTEAQNRYKTYGNKLITG